MSGQFGKLCIKRFKATERCYQWLAARISTNELANVKTMKINDYLLLETRDHVFTQGFCSIPLGKCVVFYFNPIKRRLPMNAQKPGSWSMSLWNEGLLKVSLTNLSQHSTHTETIRLISIGNQVTSFSMSWEFVLD